MLTVKEAMDDLFRNVKFDASLYKKIMHKNIAFITKNDDHKNFFGGQLIGCYPVMYTLTDQNGFFSDLYNLEYTSAAGAMKEITTLNQSYKVSADPINITIMYTVYRFFNNKALSQTDKHKFALSILDYFSYRTISVIISNYFIYPINENEAVSLLERLSNRYIIKQKKNWIEYCQYRSQEFIDRTSKFVPVLTKLNDDNMLAAAINDLFIRTKDTLKNIYKEFIDMNNSGTAMSSRKTSVVDIDGKDILADKVNSPDSYYKYVVTTLSDKNSFIKEECVEIAVSIIKTVDYSSFKKFLLELMEFIHEKKDNYKMVTDHMHSVINTALAYLVDNDYLIRENHNLLYIIEKISSNVLHARGQDLEINLVKDEGALICAKVMKIDKGNKKIFNIRNSFYVYIVLRSLSKKYYS